MTAFAVSLPILMGHSKAVRSVLYTLAQHTDYITFFLQCGVMSRLADSSRTCFSIWCHTPSWANTRITRSISSWSRRSGISLSGTSSPLSSPSFPLHLYSYLQTFFGIELGLHPRFYESPLPYAVSSSARSYPLRLSMLLTLMRELLPLRRPHGDHDAFILSLPFCLPRVLFP